MDIIQKYFPDLPAEAVSKFEALFDLYKYWNDRINVISRKDFEHFYERHVLHSMSISKIISFKDRTEVLDVGTGGGFPGIPLAILFPATKFHLVDSIAKKISVVKEVANELGLDNVESDQIRVENMHKSYDFIVSRAVTNLPDFCKLVSYRIHQKSFNALENGILYLKGGDFQDELKMLSSWNPRIYNLEDYYTEPFFETKRLLHLAPDKRMKGNRKR